MKDYYTILGLVRDASEADIKIAYKKLSIKFHPDKNDGDAFFEERFKEVQEAYEVLSNPLKRATYDAELDPRSAREHLERIDTEKPIVPIFDVSKKVIREGETITIRWQTVHANEVHIDCVGKVETSGTKTIRLPMLYDKERVLITLTATNTYISQKTTKQVEVKNKSYKERQVHLLYDSEGNVEKVKETPPVVEYKNEEEEAEPKIEQKTFFNPPKEKTESPKNALDKRIEEERALAKEERLSGIQRVIAENEKGDEPGFRLSDMYIYIVLAVLLIFITMMTVFVYNMNPF